MKKLIILAMILVSMVMATVALAAPGENSPWEYPPVTFVITLVELPVSCISTLTLATIIASRFKTPDCLNKIRLILADPAPERSSVLDCPAPKLCFWCGVLFFMVK